MAECLHLNCTFNRILLIQIRLISDPFSTKWRWLAFAEWLANLLPLVEYNMWQIAACPCPYYICNDITVASILFFTSGQAHSDRYTSQSFLFPLEQVYFTEEWYWNRGVNIFVWKLKKSHMISTCTKVAEVSLKLLSPTEEGNRS